MAVLPSTLESWDRRELAAEDWGAFDAEPLIKHGRVNLTEVGVKFYVAVLEIVQAGVLADQTGLHSVAGEEGWSGGSVVGSLAGVFLQSSSELAERHGQNAISMTVLVHVTDEGVECSA